MRLPCPLTLAFQTLQTQLGQQIITKNQILWKRSCPSAIELWLSPWWLGKQVEDPQQAPALLRQKRKYQILQKNDVPCRWLGLRTVAVSTVVQPYVLRLRSPYREGLEHQKYGRDSTAVVGIDQTGTISTLRWHGWTRIMSDFFYFGCNRLALQPC